MKLFTIFNNAQKMTGFEAMSHLDTAVEDGIKTISTVFHNTVSKFDYSLIKQLNDFSIPSGQRITHVVRDSQKFTLHEFISSDMRLTIDDLFELTNTNWLVPASLLAGDVMAAAQFLRKEIRKVQRKQLFDYREHSLKLYRHRASEIVRLKRGITVKEKELQSYYDDAVKYRHFMDSQEKWLEKKVAKKEHKNQLEKEQLTPVA